MIRRIFFYCTLLAITVFGGLSAVAGPLQDAIEAGDIERVKSEIATGANVNEADLMLGQPLMIAAQRNNIAIAGVLLNNGADVNGWDTSGSALHAAALSGHETMVDFLIDAGANIDFAPDGKTTPLHLAAANGLVGVSARLVRRGARVDGAKNRNSPMHLAARAGHIKVVLLLMASGANIEHNNRINHTPLHEAVWGGHIAIMEVLIDAGADLEPQGSDDTPLDVAKRNKKRTDILDLLIQRGAVK